MSYTNQLTKHIVEKIKSMDIDYTPSVIIDAGSRDLDQSIEFAKAFPKAKIVAFEPNPSAYALCLEKAKNYQAITVFPYAISDINGEYDFHISPQDPGCSSLLEPDITLSRNPCGTSYNTIKVKTIRLDDFLREMNISKVDILWMDIQGGELLALKGLGTYINTIDFIECEASQKGYYKNHPLLPELEKFFEEHGFDHKFYFPWEGPPHSFNEGELVCVNKKFLKIK